MVGNKSEAGLPKSTPQYYISPNLFFLLEKDHILVWDYQNHQQFLLNFDYFNELHLIAMNGSGSNSNIKDELLSENLISTQPYPQMEWGWDILSKIYHIGCQNVGELEELIPNQKLTEDYLQHCQSLAANIPNLYIDKTGELIDLPEPNANKLKKVSYFDVLKQRKTCRAFNAEIISLEDLSTLLFASFGLIHGEEWDEFKNQGLKSTAIRKASPASGGLHSEEIYIAIYRVAGLQNGLYYYRPQDHKLTLLKLGDFEDQVIKMNMGQFYSKGLSFGLYITSRLDKIWWKYKHSRAYRVTMLDIGHTSQTTLLTATALGLNTWMTGAFKDSDLEKFLGIDGIKETALFFIGIGKGTGQAIPDQFLVQFD